MAIHINASTCTNKYMTLSLSSQILVDLKYNHSPWYRVVFCPTLHLVDRVSLLVELACTDITLFVVLVFLKKATQFERGGGFEFYGVA